MKGVVEGDRRIGKGVWIRATNTYLEKMKITWEQLLTWDKKLIKKTIKEYDNNNWLNELREKSTLHLYREAKLSMGYEECYSNTHASEFLAKARTNSLKLAEWKARGTNDANIMKCPLCKSPREDLEHFLIACRPLEQTRNREIFSKLPRTTNRLKTIYLLFELKSHWKETAEMIRSMWLKRKHILETST